MKNKLLLHVKVVMSCAVIVFAVSCSQFPTQFGYVGDNKLQTIALVFTPGAEGAPGDTLHVAAIFEGVPIQTYTCSLSTKYQMTQYGSDTAFDFKPINDPSATISNDSVKFSIVLPSDFFTSNPAIFKQIIAKMPDSLKDTLNKSLPVPLDSMTLEQLNAFTAMYLSQDFSSADIATKQLAAMLAQLLTGTAVIHMHINGGYTITRNIVIRYNSKMKNNPYIYPNSNPDPFWIGVYKVKNEKSSLFFSPPKQTVSDTLLCLYLKPGMDSLALAGPVRFTDTILIDTGYTYYMAADSGMIEYKDKDNVTHRDTSVDKAITYLGNTGYEYFLYTWFYHVDSLEGVAPVNSIIIGNDGGNYYANLSPPLDPAVKKVSVWVTISDGFAGELNRPVATSLREVHCYFKYSEQYTNTVKKK